MKTFVVTTENSYEVALDVHDVLSVFLLEQVSLGLQGNHTQTSISVLLCSPRQLAYDLNGAQCVYG